MVSFKNPLNFIKKANRTFNLYLKNYKKVNNFLNAYTKNQEKTEHFIKKYDKNHEKMDEFLNIYEKNQKMMNNFVNLQTSLNNDLKRTIDIFNKNYFSCKDYFFNGEEHLFNKIMNTDQFFQMCFFNNVKLLSYSLSENRIYLKTEDDIILSTNNRFYTISEIYGRAGYSVPQLHQFKEFVVFDIGMNRGYASLKFANFDSCKAVYGFEINDETYNFALENFNLNPKVAHKIKPYNFGLSNENSTVDIYCLPGCDGVTTTELEFTNIQGEWLKGKEQMKIKKAKVEEAGTVISNIIENENIDCNIVLKIDTEGAESKIIDDLISKGVLNKVDLIMGEMHLDSEDLDNKLVGFKKISKTNYTDTIYGFCYVKDHFYKVLPLKSI